MCQRAEDQAYCLMGLFDEGWVELDAVDVSFGLSGVARVKSLIGCHMAALAQRRLTTNGSTPHSIIESHP